MSVAAVSWALYAVTPDETDPAGRLVLLVLADHAHNDGSNAFPSVNTIRAVSGLSERTVQRKLASLLEVGLITLGDQSAAAGIRADRRPAVYDLALTRGVTVTPRNGSRGDTQTPREGSRGDKTPGSRGVTVTPEPRTKPTTRARVSTAPCPRCGLRVQLDADGLPLYHTGRDRRPCYGPSPERTDTGRAARVAARAALNGGQQTSTDGTGAEPATHAPSSPPSSQPATPSAGAAANPSDQANPGTSDTSRIAPSEATTDQATWQPSTEDAIGGQGRHLPYDVALPLPVEPAGAHGE